MPDKDKGFKKQSTKQLSKSGKEKLFNAIEDFVDAKTKYHIYKALVNYYDMSLDRKRNNLIKLSQESIEELDIAKEALKEKLLALSIPLEM